MARSKERMRQGSVRLPESLWSRVDALAAKMNEEDPAHEYSRNDAILRTLDRHVPPLAGELGAAPSPKPYAIKEPPVLMVAEPKGPAYGAKNTSKAATPKKGAAKR